MSGSTTIGRKVVLRDPSDPSRNAVFDPMFQVPVTVSIEHYEVHEGDSYSANIVGSGPSALAFKVPAGTKRAHMVIGYEAEGPSVVRVWEGRTWGANSGSTHPAYNRNRNSANTTMLQENKSATPAWTAGALLADPTAPTGGTTILDFITWSDKRQTVMRNDVQEFILKNDETYYINVSTVSASNLILNWYEHTDG